MYINCFVIVSSSRRKCAIRHLLEMRKGNRNNKTCFRIFFIKTYFVTAH